MMRKKNRKPLLSISVQESLIQHKGHWLGALKIQPVDLESRSDFEKEVIIECFQSVLKSIPSEYMVIFRKYPLDYSEQIFKLESNILRLPNQKLKEYGESYIDYVKEVMNGKQDKINYLIIKTQKKCGFEEGKQYLNGVFSMVVKSLGILNMRSVRVEGDELHSLYTPPDFIKEEVDYFIYGKEVRKTYVIKDYPRSAHPNWLKPIFDYDYPIELTQHFYPIPKSVVIKRLEILLAKLQSTMNLQTEHGDVVSSELKVRKEDTLDLLKRLASGEDQIVELSFYITISANDIELLEYRSYEIESYMRQCGLEFRTCRKEVNEGISSILPICENHNLESYTFDTKSLATLLPFTVQDYTNKSGILYGMSTDTAEMVCLDLWSMPNPTKIILGKSGFGKSMLCKTETARHIINGVQAIILDHKDEWKSFCDILGGVYVYDLNARIDWNHHLIVFSSDISTDALRIMWSKIQSEDVKKRVLILEEFHNILRKDKELLLQVAKEVRKTGTAPTFITQNVLEFLISEEGRMIFDNCAIKVLMHQGENDLQEVAKLFNLSKTEKMFLSQCPIGYGYLYTDLYKTRFKSDFSEKEKNILSTNPIHKLRRNHVEDLRDVAE